MVPAGSCRRDHRWRSPARIRDQLDAVRSSHAGVPCVTGRV